MFYGLNKFIKQLLPKRLFYRSLLIVAVPIIVFQFQIRSIKCVNVIKYIVLYFYYKLCIFNVLLVPHFAFSDRVLAAER